VALPQSLQQMWQMANGTRHLATGQVGQLSGKPYKLHAHSQDLLRFVIVIKLHLQWMQQQHQQHHATFAKSQKCFTVTPQSHLSVAFGSSTNVPVELLSLCFSLVSLLSYPFSHICSIHRYSPKCP